MKGKIKRVVLLVCLILFVVPCYAAGESFSDLNGHWSKPFVMPLIEKHAISGMGDGLFHPDAPITFPQFITIMISTQYGAQKPTDSKDWASGYMKKALELSIIDEADMANNGAMTRLEAARVSHMALKTIAGEADEEDISRAAQLVDLNACKSCRYHLEQVYAKGIVSGRPGFVFDGEAGLTRAEACVIIMKVFDPTLRTLPPANTADQNAVEQTKVETLAPDAALKMLDADKNALLLDVRPESDYKKGHIKGSISMPYDELTSTNAAKLTDKGETIIVYCQVGKRSLDAYNFLKGLGYADVYNLGGINHWPYDVESSEQ